MKIYVLSVKSLTKYLIALVALSAAFLVYTSYSGDREVFSPIRDLPIYSVDCPDKKVSITFDCAWEAGNYRYLERLREFSRVSPFISTFLLINFPVIVNTACTAHGQSVFILWCRCLRVSWVYCNDGFPTQKANPPVNIESTIARIQDYVVEYLEKKWGIISIPQIAKKA